MSERCRHCDATSKYWPTCPAEGCPHQMPRSALFERELQPKPRAWTLLLETLIVNDLNEAQKERFSSYKRPYIHVIEYSAYERRDFEAKKFCEAYNNALQTIVDLKKRLGEDPGDY